jgi:hypothetical protein
VLVAMRHFTRSIARQRFAHIGLGQTELSSDFRRRDASFEGSTNCI